MASHLVIVDSSARRHQIKTTPTTYLRDVLEDVCRKLGRDPDQYTLSDLARPPKALDLSTQVRLSGLPNGAKLQLVQASRSPSVISVALQLPQSLGGGRLQDRFPSDTSFWLLLRKFEEGAAGHAQKLNITQRGRTNAVQGAGTLEYEQPIVNIMGRELKTFGELQKSLMGLGFNGGTVLVRLDFASSGQPMHAAMEQITEYFAKADSGTSVTEKTSPEGPAQAGDETHAQVSLADAVQHTTTDRATTQDEKMIDADPVAIALQHNDSPKPEGDIAVYKPPINSTPRAAQAAHEPSDYEPSIEHAKLHQSALQRSSQNQRLPSDAELAQKEQEKQDKIASIQKSTVRIRLPDQMMIDVQITPDDTAASIYTLARSKLAAPDEPFALRFTGPKGLPVSLDPTDDRKRLIRDLGFLGRVLVTMVWSASDKAAPKGPVLKESLRAQAVELKIPDVQSDAGSSTGGGGSRSQDKGKAKVDVEARMKKFLGFGKKK